MKHKKKNGALKNDENLMIFSYAIVLQSDEYSRKFKT